MIGHQAGYVGVVADQVGYRVVNAFGKSTGTVSSLAGLSGESVAEGVWDTSLTVAGFIPALNDVAAVLSIGTDIVKTAVAVGSNTKNEPVDAAGTEPRIAHAFNAECYLIPAPALVDSPATKAALIERCGLGEVYDFARALDAVVVSVGSLGPAATVSRFALIGEPERKLLSEYGGVGELLCNVFDREGRIVDHPINERVMSVPLEAVRAAPIRVLAAGGAHKFAAIDGAIKLLKPTTLVTDVATARRLTERP